MAFTTSNNSFGPTEISYLENRFCALATAAKRYIVKNGNEPTIGNVTEEKESELGEFIDYAKIVIGTLGHKVFEPVVKEQTFDQSQTGAELILDDEPLFLYDRKTGSAKGRRTTEGFVIFKGSVIANTLQQSCPENARKLREKYADEIDVGGVLLADLLFSSPSTAAAFVAGSSANGNIVWKTKDGLTLKEVENAE